MSSTDERRGGGGREVLILGALTVLCYYYSSQCELVFDDISAIKENKDLRPASPLKNIFLNDFWGTPMRKEHSHKSYRPLTVLTFRWNFLAHGVNPFGYHLVNIFLHLFVCILFRRLCAMLVHSESTGFLASLLFAVHPVHSEAVTGVVGRAELLSSIFYLGAFISYARAVSTRQTNWLQLFTTTGLCIVCSMLCKEQGITITGVCFVYELFVVQSIRPLSFLRAISTGDTKILMNGKLIKRLTFLVAVTVLILAGRLYVIQSQLPVFTKFDNPASSADTPTRQLTFLYLIFVNMKLMVFPTDLCCDWTMGTIPLITGFTDVRNISTLFALSALAAIALAALFTRNHRHSTVVTMCLILMVLPFLPASNLFFPVGFVVAERVLYMPSMGYCLLVAYGFKLLRRKYVKMEFILQIGFAVLIASHTLQTIQRNYDWKDEYTLFTSGIRVNQRNAKLFNNVGHALENKGEFREALNYFQQAVRIQEDDIGAHINVGRTYNHLKMYKEAEEAYLKAKSLFPKVKPGESYQARIAPNHLNVFLNLANLISKNSTRLEEADHLYKQAISMRSDYVQAYINRGDVLMKLNRTSQAQQVYEKALLYDNENPDIYYNLGVVFLEQGKASQANVYFNKALELKDDHEQALLNSAILLQEIGGEENRQNSRQRLYKLLDLNENNERVYFNLGMLAMDDGNAEEAEHNFKRAIHLKDGFRSALFNLALLLADSNRSLEAVPFLNQLIQYHPDHVKGLILLGDIYINHIKDLDEAEHCYHSILKYEPYNIQGLHNLCVVHVERGKLAKARSCLQLAHQLAPHEDYILKHLKIVQSKLEKIRKLPVDSSERKLAFSDYDPKEFDGGGIISKNSSKSRHKEKSREIL